jgi:aminopeptidase I
MVRNMPSLSSIRDAIEDQSMNNRRDETNDYGLRPMPTRPAQQIPPKFAFPQSAQRSTSITQICKSTDSCRASYEPKRTSAKARDALSTLQYQATKENASRYTKPFCDFLTDNPTVFHAVVALKKDLQDAGYQEISERDAWSLKAGGRYVVERNGSSLIAFVVGSKYEPGNGAAILAGHIDALTVRLKPVSKVPNKAGYIQLGVAPYAGGLNATWMDRDLGIGGRVLVKSGGKVVTKLVKLDWPIARVPTLAPHFGAPSNGPFNAETQLVPVLGLDDSDASAEAYHTEQAFDRPSLLAGQRGLSGGFESTQPPALVEIIKTALGLKVDETIANWELELFDVQPATVGGLKKDFIFAGRIDDKLCSWAALQALIESTKSDTENSSLIKVVALFDDEEIGSGLRQGARGNFLPQVIERAVGSLADHTPGSDLMGRTYANSFLVSSDVTHAVNPNFLSVYLENHAPHLNTGVAVAADPNGHMTTDSVSTAIYQACADKVGAKLQVFQIRNDSRSGGTVGPMLSSATGIRAIDAGLPQLSMHSIRATTGALDPGLGVLNFVSFLNNFESVDKEFK